MPLAPLLAESRILLNLKAKTKAEVLRVMVDRLVSIGRLRDEDRVKAIEALEARERVASTALDHGIALPHATVEAASGIEAVLGILPDGVPFDAPGGARVNFVILLLIPRSAVRKYSSTLAGIARLMIQEETRQALLRAQTPQEAYEFLREREPMDSKEHVP